MQDKNEMVLFQSNDGKVTIPVMLDQDTVWLTRLQLAELFDRDVKTIGKHINNALKEEVDSSVVAKFATTAADGKTYQTEHYNLDMIISVGYRVKSQRGVEFRRWANSVLKQYIIQGYAVNKYRMKQLGEAVRLMKRIETDLDTKQVLNVVESFSKALDLLDDYDHQTVKRPKGTEGAYILTYEECRGVIDQMRFVGEHNAL